jgi:ubiquinone/menaquinone biosynthesis C-methylase UbiE
MIRQAEMDSVLAAFSSRLRDKDLLEIGSGTGQQLGIFREICRSVVGVELSNCQYSHGPEVMEYDGNVLPFPDASFDVVFSSHVLEHLTNDQKIHSEMRRVLRPGGFSIHVVPVHGSKFYTFLTHYPATARRLQHKFLSKKQAGPEDGHGIAPQVKRSLAAKIFDLICLPRHGEYGNRISELFLMRPAAWKKRLEVLGWQVTSQKKIELAYSGYGLLGTRLGVVHRQRMAQFLIPTTMIFELVPQTARSG